MCITGKKKGICQVELCCSPVYHGGLCNRHRLQLARKGIVTPVHPFESVVSLPGEIWKPVVRYEGYIISNYGRVLQDKNGELRYIKNRVIKKGKMKPFLEVSIGDKYTPSRVHILLAEAFIPNTHNDSKVIAIDGDYTNAQLGNIQWQSLYRDEEAVESLKRALVISKSDFAPPILDYLNGKNCKLNSYITKVKPDLEKAALFQISKLMNYSMEFDRDFVQESFQEGFKKILCGLRRGQFKDTANFNGWCASIIRNAAINIITHEFRYKRIEHIGEDGHWFNILDLEDTPVTIY